MDKEPSIHLPVPTRSSLAGSNPIADIVNTKNGGEKLEAMEAFCRDEGIEFYFLFNDHTGGHTSDKLFHDNVMKCLRSVQSHGLTPELGTIQSWYKHPMKKLPEDEPHTFMYLAKELTGPTRTEMPYILHGRHNP